MKDYRLIAEAVRMYDEIDTDLSLDEFVDEYARECISDAQYSALYEDDCDPYAYQQDLIDSYRFER